MPQHADYTFLGTTQSLCPECLALLPAKIIARGRRVYFKKQCPDCGPREDFVCSDVAWYDRTEFMLPSQLPQQYGSEPQRGCPFDCGLCTEHEQHTCVGLVELTSSCNLSCPMCFASSGPGGKHLPKAACLRAIDRLIEVEGQAEVLQLSGGEPTIHPDFESILRYAVDQPIDYVMINTNGVRFAHDAALVDFVAQFNDRVEIFFQLDGLRPETTQRLRGQDLLASKLRAIERLGSAGLNITLAVTLQGGINLDEIGPLIEFAAERPWVTAINFQPATYTGRHELPEVLEQRITFPDVIKAAATQTAGIFREDDFLPLPCAHPNCHSVSYAFRSAEGLLPLARFIDARQNFDLLANGITLNRERASQLINQLLAREGCCGGACDQPLRETDNCRSSSDDLASPSDLSSSAQPVAAANPLSALPLLSNSASGSNGSSTKAGGDDLMHAPSLNVIQDFYTRVLAREIGARDLLRITITSFLDAYTFDVRRLMKCCTHHVLPSGHVIPFCAYNTLYREGHVELPELRQQVTESSS